MGWDLDQFGDLLLGENKKLLKRYDGVFNGIMDKIKKIDADWLEYSKDYMKIKFNSDNNLPLNKPLKFYNITLTIRYTFSEDNKLYPQVFLYDALYSLYKILKYGRIDISEGIDVDKTNKSEECKFCHYWYFLNKNFSYGSYLCDGCFDISQRSTDFKNIAIVHVKKSTYRIYFQHMSKHEAKKIMTKFDLIGKMGEYLL